MIESNIISWIELGDSMQYIDVYGKRKMVKLFNFLRILMVYNSFTTFFFIILHFIFFIQLAMLCLLGVPSGNDWIVKIFKFFWNVFLLENIIQGETSYKIAIIIITAVTFVIIGCSIFLMICIINEKIYFKLPITIVNIIIILLIYYIIGPIAQICIIFTNCDNGKHKYLQTACFSDISHILITVASIFNFIFYLLFSLAMSLYYNEIGTLSNANVKTRINCNYEIYANIAKIIIYLLEYIIENHTNRNKILLIILEVYIFLNALAFSFYVYKTVLFHDERMNLIVHFGWVFTAWFALVIAIKTTFDVQDSTIFVISGWIIIGIIYYEIIINNNEYYVTDFNILEAKEIKEVEIYKEKLLNLLDDSSLRAKTILIGYIRRFEEMLSTYPELKEKYEKIVGDNYLNKKLNPYTVIPIYAIIYIVYAYHIEKAQHKIDMALNMCYFLINRLKNPTYAIQLCSELKVDNYKHLYFKYMLMEAIKEYLVNKISKSTNRESVKHVQIGSVILYNIYNDLFKMKIYEATSNQIDYFDHLKNSVTTSKTTENFLKIGENILKLRSEILTLWDKIIELNPFSDDSERDYMLYLSVILQDDVLAKSEAKKYSTIKNNRLSERNNVYHTMFMHDLSAILLIDGHFNNGKILYTTPNFPSLFMFTGKELLNTSINDLIPDVIQPFHKELMDDAIKYSNLNFLFKTQRDFLLKGKGGGLFNIKMYIKTIPNISFGLIYIAYLRKILDNTFMIILDKNLKITGFTETASAGAAFTMNSNYGLTQSLQGHHISAVIPEILLQMEYKDGQFIISKSEVDLKGNLYPVNGWKELDHKIDNVLQKIKTEGKLEEVDDEQKNIIKEYEELLNEITIKYQRSFSVFYKIVPRIFLGGKYLYYRLYITNDLVAMNETTSHEASMKKTKSIHNIGGTTFVNNEIENNDKEIKFKLSIEEKVEDNENIIENNGENINENNENIEPKKEEELIDDDLNVNINKKKSIKEVKSAAPSSILTKASMETAVFNKLKNGIISNRETSTVRLMKYLTFLYGVATIAFIVFDSIRNKNNLNEMGEYLKENLYFNHSKIAVASLYFAGLNLKWLKDEHINITSCPNEDCREFYTNLLVEAINDIKTQKENFTSFYEDFRDILKQEQEMELVLYNLNYTDKIRIDTDNLLNLLVFNGLKLKAGLDIYFNGTKNGVYDIASSNLLSQSLNYIYSNISSFRSAEKEVKVHDNFKLVPISLICISITFIILIIGFIYLVYKIHITEIYFLERLINFNTFNFDAYIKSLEELKKRLRNENADEESNDEDMELESKKMSKKDEDEKIEKKKKDEKNEQKNEQKRKKKKSNKSNKAQQLKAKKKKVMSLFFFKWNLFFSLKVIIILIVSLSYYLVSMIIESNNKSNYLDFDQTTDSIEGIYKTSFDLYLSLKTEMESFEEQMRLQIDNIYDFADGNIQSYSYYLSNGTRIDCIDNKKECVGQDVTEAIKCVNDINCNKNTQIYQSLCWAVRCINEMPNYIMHIPTNEELTTPKMGNLLMPLVSGVNDYSTETEKKLNQLYNSDACSILLGESSENSIIYQYCVSFWSNILMKGMEQGITQMGVSVASVTDELNSLNDLGKVLDNVLSGESIDNPKTFDDLMDRDAAFFQFGIFVEYYLFKSYIETYRIFDILRDVKLENIKSSFDIILYCYAILCIILLIVLLFLVNQSKYLLNSFLNFIGILPVKYLIEDENFYQETLRLEEKVYY